jgi:hypothetical protein
MKTKTMALGLSMMLLSGATLADDDCDDPVSGWQPRENLRQQLEADGWTVYRIKVDDGCYEVKAQDNKGHRVEASFAPASLELMDFEREDEDDEDDYEDESDDDEGNNMSNQAPAGEQPLPSNGIVNSRPTVTVQ